MAFSWTTVNDGTIISGAQWNEVQTNADTLISNLGLAPYGWSELPVTQGVSKFEPAEVTDLRAALDYAHDNNTCSAENETHDSSINSGENTVYDEAVYISVYEANYTTKEDAEFSDDNVTRYDSVLGALNTTIYTTLNGTYKSGVETVNKGTNNASYT
jgi:hypothetical protein